MNSKKTILVVLAVLILAGIVFIAYKQNNGSLQNYYGTSPSSQESDTSAAINQDLESINFGDIESEFQGIDQELNNL